MEQTSTSGLARAASAFVGGVVLVAVALAVFFPSLPM
jgi:hypothetical protein